MSAITTFMPASANTWAMPKPTPEAPPVMKAVLPSTIFIRLFLRPAFSLTTSSHQAGPN